MRKLREEVRHGGLSAAGTLVSILLTFVRVKLLAVMLGPAGVGLLGLVNNFTELAAGLFAAGCANILIIEIARVAGPQDRGRIWSVTTLGAIAPLLLSSPILIIAFFLLTETLSATFVGVILLELALVASTLWRLIAGLLMGDRSSGHLFWALFIGPLFSIAVTALMLFGGVRDPFLLAVTSSTTQLIGMLALGSWREVANIRWLPLPNRAEMLPIIKQAVPISLSLALGTACWFYLRIVVETRLGPLYLGYLQPAFQIITLAGGLFNSFCSMNIVRWDQSGDPPFGRRQLSILACSCVWAILGSVSWLLTPLLEWMVRLVFSREFLPVTSSLPYFLFAESLRQGSFLLNQTLISKGYGKAMLWPRVACLGVIALMVEFGFDASLVGIGAAYLAAHAVLFALSVAQWVRVQHKPARLLRGSAPSSNGAPSGQHS